MKGGAHEHAAHHVCKGRAYRNVYVCVLAVCVEHRCQPVGMGRVYLADVLGNRISSPMGAISSSTCFHPSHMCTWYHRKRGPLPQVEH